MEVDYNKLKFFLSVVRNKSITHAANELHRTQSAVSQAITALEKQLGFKLITWEGKRMNLTREGKQVYDTADRQISLIEEQLASIQQFRQSVGGVIEIGMLNDHSTSLHEKIFSVIGAFRSQYPAVSFKVRFATSAQIEHGLLERELDIGFLINFQSMYRFQVVEVATEQHLITTTPAYMKKIGHLASVREVIAADLIDIDPTFTCFTPWVRHHDSSAFEELQKKAPVISVPDFIAIKGLVLAGLGISVLPRYLIVNELKERKLIQIMPKIESLKVWVHSAIEQGRQIRLAEQLFLNAITTYSN